MRAFLIVVAFIGAVLALLVAAGAYWWHRNGESIVAASRTALDEGHRRGNSVNETACLAEALQRRRPDRDDNMAEAISRSLWLDGCLRSSRIEASFCDGVPQPHEFIDIGKWVAAACERRGTPDPGCQSIHQEVAKYCASPGRAAKIAGTAG